MVKFLVVRFSSIGDIVLTTPVVRHLKKQVDDVEVPTDAIDRSAKSVNHRAEAWGGRSR